MTERSREEGRKSAPELDRKVERLDEDLTIMERHAEELAQVEDAIQEDMRRRDREYKDSRLHSVPKPRKHMR